MSSKKKDKKKGGKSKKEKKEGPEPVIEIVDETSKQFYLIQIKDLEEKLTRYQRKSDELEIVCKKYEGEFDSLSNDKKDIISNLKKELERKTDEILDLNDKLVGLQQAKDSEKEAFEKQLTDLRTEFQETKDNLTNQNNALHAQLSSLDEFRTQKEDLLAKLAGLERNIRNLEIEHQDKLYDIEKKMVLDKDRLKKDMIVKVNQVAADFRRVSNKQMADTTKRTIRENVSINAQLQKMSEKIVELISDNDKTKLIEKDFKQQVDLLEDNEKELARKNASNIKVIRMLTEKCRNQEIMIAELEEKFNEMQESEINNSQIIIDLEQKSKDLKNLTDENEELKKLTHILQSEEKLAKNSYSKIEKVINDAAHSITIFLSKNSAISKSLSMDNIEKIDDHADSWTNVEKRKYMLENLLTLLNSAAAINIGPKLKDFNSEGYHRPRTTEHPAANDRKNEENRKGLNFHYTIGDLGIVPRKDDHLLSNIQKMKSAEPQRQLGSLKKVTRKTIATQTIDLAKASIFTKIEYEDKNNWEPMFESTKNPKKTKKVSHFTATDRVINKVF